MFGLLNLHKPAGPTSRDCVNKVQRLVKPIKVGHAGTLDPIASGVLIILVGNATRLTDEIHALNKEYVGTFQLGVSSPSVDIETESAPIENAPEPERSAIEVSLRKFLGEIEQVPPIYSAVRIAGKRAHEIAREGKSVEMPSRRVTIEELELLDYQYPFFKLRTVCSTGTYIRSLGRDIARSLGSDAIMTQLIRSRIGDLTLENSVTLESVESASFVESNLLPPQMALKNFQKIVLPQEVLHCFHCGQKVSFERIDELGNELLYIDSLSNRFEQLLVLDHEDRMRAIIQSEANTMQWRTAKFFN